MPDIVTVTTTSDVVVADSAVQIVDVGYTLVSSGGGGAVSSVFTRSGAVVATSGDYAVGQVTGAAPLASPAFTGTPTAPTKSALTNNTDVATTAYTDAAVAVETTRAEAAEALRQYIPVAAPLPSGDTTGATDTAALNTALASLVTREALLLTVPGYYINAPLSVPSGCGITGTMAYGVGGTPHIKASTTFSGAAMIANHGWLNNVTFGEDGIEVSNLFIDGSNGGTAGPFVSTNGHGIILATSHSHVHHCYLLNISGAGIVFADSNQAGSPITSGTIQENYCWDNKVANAGQYGIWVQKTGGSLGMTDGVIARNIVMDPGNGGYYRTTGNNPQINGSNLPYEAVRMDTSAGWWVEDNHAYFCPGGAYFFGTMFGTHVLNNTADMFGTFPWSVVSGTMTATQVIGMALHGIKTDINVPSSAQNYAHPNVVVGNLLNVFEGANKSGTISPATGTSSSGCRFTYYDLAADTLSVPSGAPGQAVVTFTGNQAHQNSQGGQSVASCTTTNGLNSVTAAGGAFAAVQKGMSVTGTGIPGSTYVGSVVTGGSDSITLVASDLATAHNATANGTVTLTFPAPYSLMEKWTATTSGVVLTGVHSGNQAMGTIIAQPTISATNGAVVSLVAELGGVAVSGVPSAGQAPVASGAAAATWTAILQAANNLSDVASQQTALNNLAGAVTSGDYLRGNGTNVSMSAIQAADLPAGTTGAKGALQLDGTAGDITALGAQAAGAVGKAADAGHVHPTTGMLTLLGTTGLAGFALQNATPTIFTWTAPNDGNMHRVTLFGTLIVASTETGGGLALNLTDASNTSRSPVVFAGALTGGNKLLPSGLMFTVYPNTAVSLVQSSALTGGAATLYLEMWGS